MADFFLGLEWFVYGAISGVLARPTWYILTTIVKEAKIAKNEWRKGPE
jgi:hypothetical protein